MRKPALTAILACLLFAVDLVGGTSAGPAAWEAYTSRLAKSCPGKRLEMLAPGELLDIVDEFTGSLPSNKQKIVKASEQRSCRGVEMGATCDNTGFLEAAIQIKELDRFVSKVCALPERCKDYSDCTEVQ
jgi:hypothetical protein